MKIFLAVVLTLAAVTCLAGCGSADYNPIRSDVDPVITGTDPNARYAEVQIVPPPGIAATDCQLKADVSQDTVNLVYPAGKFPGGKVALPDWVECDPDGTHDPNPTQVRIGVYRLVNPEAGYVGVDSYKRSRARRL